MLERQSDEMYEAVEPPTNTYRAITAFHRVCQNAKDNRMKKEQRRALNEPGPTVPALGVAVNKPDAGPLQAHSGDEVNLFF
jgi:hypothetical protein